jgi:large repetitive protein
VIQGDYLGTDVAGTHALGNTQDGLTIFNSPNNTVGGSAPGEQNLISGNGFVGVRIVGTGSFGNLVQHNLIGTDVTGTQAVPNGFDGVFIDGAPNNTIGGAGNVISGNAQIGVQIFGPNATGNVVLGNLIGTDVTGTHALGNGFDGVWLNNAPGNLIGSTIPSEHNVISANGFTGIRITGTGATLNVIQGNLIGTDITGTQSLGNGFDGIFIDGAPGNLIGGITPGSGNVASGNGSVGLQIFGPAATGNVVQGNFFGTDVTGMQPLANRVDGVFINDAPFNVIGGTDPAARNLMSGNGSAGIQLFARGSKGNVVQGNFIGANIDGKGTLGNDYGLFINGAPQNTIGGAAANEKNVIIGNRIANIIEGFGLNNAATGGAVVPLVVQPGGPIIPASPPTPTTRSQRAAARAALRAARRAGR